MQRITDLDNSQAKEFFMRPEQYCNIELPGYFKFDDVLEYCEKELSGKNLTDCVGKTSPDKLTGVNLDILLNKDGQYAVRPLTIINPIIYTLLVNTITKPDAWQAIMSCFKHFDIANISNNGIPVIPDPEKKEPFHQATTILNWWNSMEQEQFNLSLEYSRVFVSDISNCFGQITSQDIENALTLKDTPYETPENLELARSINALISAMQNGRNIGIPQGNAVTSFIAEIVLGYADLLLHLEVQKANITAPYRVLRYVDDYRIFCNDISALETISYALQHVLIRLNFMLNASKTRISSNIVANTLKPDKAYYYSMAPISGKYNGEKWWAYGGFQKHLYFIFEFARKFPNSGRLKVLLSEYSQRIEEYNKLTLVGFGEDNPNSKKKKDKKTGKLEKINYIPEQKRPIIAIALQIALDNIPTSHYALRVISLLLKNIRNEEEREDITRLIYNRLRGTSNSEYMQIWLQTVTYNSNDSSAQFEYDMPLCLLADDSNVQLWNNSWLSDSVGQDIPYDTIFSKDIIQRQHNIIHFRERINYDESWCIEDCIFGDSPITISLDTLMND